MRSAVLFKTKQPEEYGMKHDMGQLDQYRDALTMHRIQLENVIADHGEDTIISDTIRKIGNIIVKIDIQIAIRNAEATMESALDYLEQ